MKTKGRNKKWRKISMARFKKPAVKKVQVKSPVKLPGKPKKRR